MEGTMEDDEDFTAESLQNCSYRVLQQTAKRLNLPSNVKKIYLIQLIHMKKFGLPGDVEKLADKVRSERKLLSQVRKKTVNKKKHLEQQIAEISSTCNTKSPPISNTPKRTRHIMVRYSPDVHSPASYTRRQQTRYQPVRSDRVLRSFKAINNNGRMDIIRSTNEKRDHETMCQEQKYQKIDMTYIKRRSDTWSSDIVPVQRSANVSPPPTRRQRKLSGIYPLAEPIVTVRRADGTLTKINAIIQKTVKTYNNYDNRSLLNTNNSQRALQNRVITPQIIYNNIDNRTASRGLQSIVYNPITSNEENYEITTSNYNKNQENYEYPTSNFNKNQENYLTTSNFNNNQEKYEISSSNLINNQENYGITSSNYNRNDDDYEISSSNFRGDQNKYEIISTNFNKGKEDNYAVYYHKKIRAEHIRSLKTREVAREVPNEKLPKITDAFSKFNTVHSRDVTQPVYVQVDNEPDGETNMFAYRPDVPCNQTSMLESLFNFKNSFLVNKPLLQIYTTSNTTCVFSTPIMSTAKAQPSATSSSLYNFASEPDSDPYCGSEEFPRVQDFFKDFRCDDNVSPLDNGSRSSTDTLSSQDLGATVTIPEMVEDALELISQDGDYMERMGMDIRMQCILCSWAGPKIILDLHLRKHHSSEIIQADINEWCVTYTLGSLCARLWLSRVIEYQHQLYVLSARYEDTDCFMATLSILSSEADTPKSAQMTIYNKVTGEPFTWEGEVQQVPPSLPYEDFTDCFKLEISKIDLLPNSANIRLLNRELVGKSPTKVVVGQPELDNIHISLLIKLFDTV